MTSIISELKKLCYKELNSLNTNLTVTDLITKELKILEEIFLHLKVQNGPGKEEYALSNLLIIHQNNIIINNNNNSNNNNNDNNSNSIYHNNDNSNINNNINNLRELAPQLTPEDPSCEAYWVANGNWRQAGSRQLGRL